MSRKTYVIDTNVLLHDPDAVKKFSSSKVVIPMMVLEELDTMKKQSDELGKNARQVIRYIDSIKEHAKGSVHSGMTIEGDSTLQVYLGDRGSDKSNFPLSLDKSANRILLAAFQLKQQGEDVCVVSKDFLMRVKSEAIGIPAEDYENLKVAFETLYKGHRELIVPKRDIDQFFKDSFLKVESESFYPNEYVLLKCAEHSSALCKYNYATEQLEPLLKLGRDIWGVHPLNIEQKFALDMLLRDDIKLITLVGQAGTGKTLLALAAGMKKVFDDNTYNKILITRPIIPLGKDIGYLPGTKEEKLYHWMQPIYDNLEFLCESTGSSMNTGETLKWVMESKKIEMEAVTYIRGRTLPKIYMIIDEAQNLTPHEVKTVISRAGEGTKVILTGDPSQIDNPYLDRDSNALTFTIGKFKDQKIFGNIILDRTERSELARLAAEIM